MTVNLKARMPSYKKLYKTFPDGEKRAAFAEKEYNSLRDHLIALGILNGRRAKIVDRLVRDYVEFEFAYIDVMKKPPVGVGPNGGDVYSMHRAALDKVQMRILKLEESLKIPPQKEVTLKVPDKNKTPADEFLK